MGRPPSNGGPSFRFNPTEVAEMDAILQAHNCQIPAHEILVALAEKFSISAERSGKVIVQMKQVWNWFQNRRYALRAKAAKVPGKLNVSSMPRDDLVTVRSVPQAPQYLSVPPVQSAARKGSDSSQMEFEAKSARDGAWYDVANFLSHKSLETGDPEVLVRFAGFGAEEDEWVNIRKHVRQRSLPCESSECVAVRTGDLILCFQEGKEQALYFDAQVLDAQRRRHDVRGCRCRFLVRYDHDLSEEIVPLKKVCRRPETDYRLQQLHAESANMSRLKTGSESYTGNAVKFYSIAEATEKQPKVQGHADTGPQAASVPHANVPVTTTAAPMVHSSAPLANATTPAAHFNLPVATPVATTVHSTVSGATKVTSVAHSHIPLVATAVAPAAHSSSPGDTTVAPAASDVPLVTGFKVPEERVFETGAPKNAGNVDTLPVTVAVPCSTDASVVSGGGSSQSMPQG